jgi:hypothetical protein
MGTVIYASILGAFRQKRVEIELEFGINVLTGKD